MDNTTSDSVKLPLLDVGLGISQLGTLDDLKEMLDIMLNQSTITTVNQIDKYFNKSDWDSFKKQVHKFKSSCLYCATTRLLKYTQELEQLADSHNVEEIKSVYELFCDCLISTKQYIETWLAQNS